ncbi:uncharacterized protein LOC111882761 [Lactuca sativa]|uniref:uncharacterized protein LOC111882761 n=1 Tax=Lactuca sativa TaxID=4236 RepID=UPI000CD8221F|nr:uncharacterized protein LOC111882761 [Lactuca sativa]
MVGPTESPGSSAKDDQVNFDDPLFVHPFDNSVSTIVTIKLIGNENFRLRKTSMSRALKARNKLGFIDGTFQKTKVDESKSSKWDRANAVVCFWLLSSISDSIYQSQAYSDVAEDIWNSLFETYNKSDGSVFLSGLDDSYSQVKSHILLMEPLPNVKTAFSILSREDQKGFSANSVTITSVGSNTPGLANPVGDSEFHQLTKEQYIKFLQLINDKQICEEAPASDMAGTCLFQDFNSSFDCQKWIVDSGANQHMIASESFFHDTVDVSKLNLLVSHPNGTSAKIEKIGNMNISNSLTLFDVFAVPNFNVNLLSVHKGLQSKEMVGNGKESGGLYYMNSVPSVKGKTVTSDNGTEFLNHKMKQLFESKGILHQTSCVHTPQQNGIVERKHRHILNVARSLIFQSGLPLKYWGEAVLTSVFLINRTPTSVLNGASPYELVYISSPVFDKLRVFGCLCFATKLNNSDKFFERADKCVFLGYSSDKKGYRVPSLDTNLIFVSRDVKFYESVFPFKLKFSSVNDILNVPVCSSDPFSYDESLYSSSLLDNPSNDNFRNVHQLDGASGDQYLIPLMSATSLVRHMCLHLVR